MTATMFVFPIARRPHHIAKIARAMAKANSTKAELILIDELRALRRALEGHGIDRARVASELAVLEGCVRATLWKLVLLDHGGAA